MGEDNNSQTGKNMYICTLSGMFEEMIEREKDIQSVQHILIHIAQTTAHSFFQSVRLFRYWLNKWRSVYTNGVY